VNDKGDGIIIYMVVQVGSGGTPGMITEEVEIFWPDTLESEIVGGAYGAPDRVSIS
jgi:hypothetical protein